jgi:hypothetical protein
VRLGRSLALPDGRRGPWPRPGWYGAQPLPGRCGARPREAWAGTLHAMAEAHRVILNHSARSCDACDSARARPSPGEGLSISTADPEVDRYPTRAPIVHSDLDDRLVLAARTAVGLPRANAERTVAPRACDPCGPARGPAPRYPRRRPGPLEAEHAACFRRGVAGRRTWSRGGLPSVKEVPRCG